MSLDSVRPLSLSSAGDVSRFHSTRLSPSDEELLGAMGFWERCLVRVLKPGDPMIVDVGGTRLGFSASLAERILVQPAS